MTQERSPLFFLWSYWFPLCIALALAHGGAWEALPLITLVILHPLADRLSQPLAQPPTPGEHRRSTVAELLLLAYPFVQLLLLGWALLTLPQGDPASVVITGLNLGLMTGAVGITAAHELVHRPRAWQRGLGVLLLTQVNYGHFRIEHVYGHHLRVGTPEDAATARLHETVYAFILRSIGQGYANAWKIETQRVAKKGGPLARVVRHRLFHYGVFQLFFFAIAGLWKGPAGLLFWAIQSTVAVLLLELINYVEHYGLERKKTESGRYEPVSERHSWDSPHRFTNAFLYNLGKHSDHHLHPNQPFEALRNLPTARTLPYGYSTLMLLALVPPLYFRITHARLGTKS